VQLVEDGWIPDQEAPRGKVGRDSKACRIQPHFLSTGQQQAASTSFAALRSGDARAHSCPQEAGAPMNAMAKKDRPPKVFGLLSQAVKKTIPA
jgi:hypothetical protein